MAPRMTDEDIEYYIENYIKLGATEIGRRKGVDAGVIVARVKRLRERFMRDGDDRWQLLLTRTPARVPEDVIRDYGVVHAPNIYADKDPRPVWLVITSPRYRISPVENRDAHPRRGNDYTSTNVN